MDFRSQMTGNKCVADKYFPNRTERFAKEYNEIRILEPIISSDMQNLASKLGTDFIGTEYSVKTASSVEDKMQRIEKQFKRDLRNYRNRFDPLQNMRQLRDIIRYTEVCEHQNVMKTAKDTIEHLQENGYVLSGISNFYATPFPNTGYQGIHLNFISPYGQEIELQVHSPESFDAKQKGHHLYEQLRSVSTIVKDKEKLKQEINQIHGSVPKPKDYNMLPARYSLPNKKQIIDERRKHISTEIEYTDLSKRPNIMTYSVTMNGSTILSGFESVFSDGSSHSYQNHIRDGFAKYSSIDKTGTEISTHDMIQREITLEEAVEITMESEKIHVTWMDKHFKDKEREEIGHMLRSNEDSRVIDHESVIEERDRK